MQHIESEASLYKALIEKSGNALFTSDIDGNLIDVNQSACDRLGYTREELLKMTVTDIEQKFDLEGARAVWDAMEPEVPVVLVGKHKRKDGYVFPVELVIGYTMVDGQKQFVSLVRNITEEAHAEYKFQKMIEAAPDPIYIQIEANFAYLNPAACQLFGVESCDELIGTPILDRVHTDSREMVKEKIELLNAEHQPRMVLNDHRMLKVNGETVWVEKKVEPITYEGKQGALVFVRDITRRKNTEAELREINQRLEKERRRAESMNAAKSQFLSNMSHELRTPLNGFMGMLQLLLTTELSEEQREYVEFSVKSCMALTGVVNDILNWTDLEKKKQNRIDEAFNPAALIHEVADLHRVTATYKSIDLHVQIAPDLPNQLMGERYKLKQILNNLVGNAVKFTEHGCVCLSVSSEPVENPNRVGLTCKVIDTGIGIPKEKLPVIFDRFVQGDESSTRVYGGVGLGLTVVRELAALMDGSLEVESSPGKGSCFTFYCEMEKGATVLSEDSFKGSRILVVDDDFPGRRVAQLLLNRLGCQVDLVASGKEAIRKHDEETYDLILMDCKMQTVTGLEVTSRIRGIEKGTSKHTPIVAMTAKTLAGDREECLKSGMDGYLEKPLEMNRLKEVLTMFIGPAASKI